MKQTPITILAGGQSRRMGLDKAQMLWNGVSLLEHLCRIALQTNNRVLVIGRQSAADWMLDDITFLPDEEAGIGPLGGLKTALNWAKNNNYQTVCVLPCDVPLLTTDAINWLLQQEIENDDWGIATHSGEQLQPLFAKYQISCLPLIDELLAQNKRSLHALICAGNFAVIEAPPEIARQLLNVNTPERMESRAKRRTKTMKVRWTKKTAFACASRRMNWRNCKMAFLFRNSFQLFIAMAGAYTFCLRI